MILFFFFSSIHEVPVWVFSSFRGSHTPETVRNVFCQGGGEGVWLNKHSRASPNVRATIHKKMNYSAFYNKAFSS